eukprot:CAMPEP_0175720388 /NCGR_PEP_ID=MMETSP0097-20121207/45171_1 /TAXON_ID=311494 /ORGANISM="Alexandrium monilatum, Strain CCMP3105" /LENGTH=678 /DNA_ID=CAMNT_0017028035 /DNA_START=103 /DNA_END=2140 /DNA_ORIENTATION=-
MEVRAHNFSSALEDIKRRLCKANFVAIDLELTGVSAAGEADGYADTAVERIEKSCRIVESYAPIQLGITICSLERELSSYSIMMAPEIPLDLTALKFVRRHNVDLNAWVDEGVRHMSREEAAFPAGLSLCREDLLEPMRQLLEQACGTSFFCEAPRLRAARQRGLDLNTWVEAQGETVGKDDLRRFSRLSSGDAATACQDPERRQAGLPRLWEVLRSARRPFVVHCGFLDVLFILAAFERRVLPRDPTRLAQLVQECFPDGIYDTAYLHEFVSAFRLWPLGLHDFVRRARVNQLKHGGDLHFHLEELTADRYGNVFHTEDDGLTHEAGYDSFLTAVLFSYLQEFCYKSLRHSLYRFYLHKSTDSLCLGCASTVGAPPEIACKVFDSTRLIVAELKDADAKDNTTKRISEARQLQNESTFFYRKMDDSFLLIPGCAQAKLVQLSALLPGVTWIDFYSWQEQARCQRSAREREPAAARTFTGVIKSIFVDRGFGFIHCPESTRIYARDVFLHQAQAAGLQEGQVVSFAVALNGKSQPQAREVKERWFTGVVRSWFPTTHSGSISCPSTFRMYGSDVHLPSLQTNDFQVGEQVVFSVVLRSGQPMARRVTRRPLAAQPGARSQEAHEGQEHDFGRAPGVAGLLALSTDMLVAGKLAVPAPVGPVRVDCVSWTTCAPTLPNV